MTRDRAAVLTTLRRAVERAREFEGWVFSDLNIRHLDNEPPWVYEDEVRERAGGRTCAIDMGTGPGERLADLREHLPERLLASEEWPPNVPRAHARLAPLGIGVVHCQSLRLPFAEEAFDLVLNRHDEFEPVEIARVLQPGGVLITQQVGNDNWLELRRHFPRATDWGDIHATYRCGLTETGLDLVSDLSYDYRVAFPSLSELVFMLTVAPWTIPDFDIDRDLEALLSLERSCRTDEGLVLTESRYLIIAERPA